MNKIVYILILLMFGCKCKDNEPKPSLPQVENKTKTYFNWKVGEKYVFTVYTVDSNKPKYVGLDTVIVLKDTNMFLQGKLFIAFRPKYSTFNYTTYLGTLKDDSNRLFLAHNGTPFPVLDMGLKDSTYLFEPGAVNKTYRSKCIGSTYKQYLLGDSLTCMSGLFQQIETIMSNPIKYITMDYNMTFAKNIGIVKLSFYYKEKLGSNVIIDERFEYTIKEIIK